MSTSALLLLWGKEKQTVEQRWQLQLQALAGWLKAGDLGGGRGVNISGQWLCCQEVTLPLAEVTLHWKGP